MPIEPIQPIHQVWNPMQALGPAMRMQELGMEGRRLDLAQEKVALDAAEAMVKNVDLPVTERYGAAQKIAATAGVKMDPADFVGAQNEWTSTLLAIKQYGPNSEQAVAAGTKLLDHSGLFRAQLEQHRKMATEQHTQQGFSQLGGQALGLERDLNPSESQAFAASKPFQDKAAEVLFPNEKDRTVTELLREKIARMKMTEQTLTQRQQQLVGATNPRFTNLEAEETYRKTIPAAKGAIGALDDLGRKSLDDDQRAIRGGTLTKQQRADAATQVKDDLYNLSAIRQQLQAQIRNANALAGTTNAVNLDEIQGQLEAVNEAITVKSAELPYLNNPLDPTAWKMMKSAYADYEKKLLTNKQEIMNLRQQQLNVSQGTLDEKKAQHLLDKEYEDRIRPAMVAYAETGFDAKQLGAIATKYNVRIDDLRKAEKDPNKPTTDIKLYDPSQSVEQAGKLVNLTQSVREIRDVRDMIVDPTTGSVNRTTLFAASLNLPFTKGRDINTFTEKAVEIKLRAATGAAARPDEVQKYLRIFGPSIKDSDDLIRYKLDALEEWMQSTADITDPVGSLRERANALLAPGLATIMKSQEYQDLRKLRPNASVRAIVKFLESKKE